MKKTENPSETPLEAPKSAETPEPSLDGSTLLSDLQRTRADFENYRKNVEKEKENFGKLSLRRTIRTSLFLFPIPSRSLSRIRMNTANP